MSSVESAILVDEIARSDHNEWRALWDAYNAFYGRVGSNALPEVVTRLTWDRFFDPREPVYALVARRNSKVVGIAHYLFHRSTTQMHGSCYLQDLYVAEQSRGLGVARTLINSVFAAAQDHLVKRVYWQTKSDNHAARALYDKLARHSGFLVYTRDL